MLRFSSLLLMLLIACTEKPDQILNSISDKNKADVKVTIQKRPLAKATAAAKAEQIDSVNITITCQEGPAQERGIKTSSPSFELRNLIPGSNCLAEAALFDEGGTLIYQGTAVGLNIPAGEFTQITIDCLPLFSQVIATFSLGAGNSSGISSGRLTLIRGLDTLSANLTIIGGEIGQFSLDQIQGGIKYALYAELKDASNTIIYSSASGDSLEVRTGESIAFQLELLSTMGQAGGTLFLMPESRVTISITTSDATSRPPEAGEINFTEIYPDVSAADGGEDGEWLEIYNRSIDTLLLDSCRIAKTLTTTGATSRHIIDPGTILPPGGVLVFGRDSVSFRDQLMSLNLTGTRQSLLLICDADGTDILIDQVNYTSTSPAPSDSIQVEEGAVASIRPTGIGQPSLLENWCLTRMSAASGYGLATPGSPLSICGE